MPQLPNTLSPVFNADYPLMVLLVDDQPLIGEAVRRLLESEADITLHYCSDPQRALEDANNIKPTVILQDLVMPNIDGLDLVQQMRENAATSQTPIIVLSTKEDAVIKGKAFEVGANDYLVKLPDKIELIARIRYHSRAYLSQLQRDQAYQALRESQRQLLVSNTSLVTLNRELEEANRIISELARHDPLTGLLNRRIFDEELEMEVKRSNRQETPLTIILLDIDHFKRINDSFGHAMGDEVLRIVASHLTKQMRPYDKIGRFGGEEFIIMLPDTLLEEGVISAERIRISLAETHIYGYPHRVTASFGVATLPAGESSSYVINRADSALYRAKRGGRNRVESDSVDMSSFHLQKE